MIDHRLFPGATLFQQLIRSAKNILNNTLRNSSEVEAECYWMFERNLRSALGRMSMSLKGENSDEAMDIIRIGQQKELDGQRQKTWWEKLSLLKTGSFEYGNGSSPDENWRHPRGFNRRYGKPFLSRPCNTVTHSQDEGLGRIPGKRWFCDLFRASAKIICLFL